MWVKGVILFIIVHQIPRLTEKPPFYNAIFSNTGSAVARDENVENRALTVKLLHPEVTHITYAYVSTSRARHMARSNLKGCEPVERGELKILASTSDVHCNERKHEWMSRCSSE